jgi:hypothetical protein
MEPIHAQILVGFIQRHVVDEGAASRIVQPEMSQFSCPATWARGGKRASYGDCGAENDLAGGVAAREVMTKDIGLAQGSLPWRHVWKKRFQIVDRGYEVALLHGHREINRVEVDFTTEAAAEIRAGVDRRMALVTTGTQECQLFLAEFVRPLQLLQEGRPRDIVA